MKKLKHEISEHEKCFYAYFLLHLQFLQRFAHLFMSSRQQNWPSNFYLMTRLWTSVRLSGHAWFSSESTTRYVSFFLFSGIESHEVYKTLYLTLTFVWYFSHRCNFEQKCKKKIPQILAVFLSKYCVLRAAHQEEMVLSVCLCAHVCECVLSIWHKSNVTAQKAHRLHLFFGVLQPGSYWDTIVFFLRLLSSTSTWTSLRTP